MTLWVIEWSGCDCGGVWADAGVFSSRDAAQKTIDEFNKTRYTDDDRWGPTAFLFDGLTPIEVTLRESE